MALEGHAIVVLSEDAPSVGAWSLYDLVPCPRRCAAASLACEASRQGTRRSVQALGRLRGVELEVQSKQAIVLDCYLVTQTTLPWTLPWSLPCPGCAPSPAAPTFTV